MIECKDLPASGNRVCEILDRIAILNLESKMDLGRAIIISDQDGIIIEHNLEQAQYYCKSKGYRLIITYDFPMRIKFEELQMNIDTTEGLSELNIIEKMNNYTNLIADVNELKWFYNNILPELEPTEVYFLSLSARSKYLSDEDKKAYRLGPNEMFQKTIVRERSWERFYRTIRKLECHEEGYTTKNNLPIPSKCLVCYININPSDTIKALNAFNKVTTNYMFELAQVALHKKDSKNIFDRINKIDNNLMIAYQQSTGTKHWIDFDMDVPKDFEIYNDKSLKNFFAEKKITKYYWIDTKSGYHLLIAKDQFKFNPHELVMKCHQLLTDWYLNTTMQEQDYAFAEIASYKHEIMLNKNQMIPMPGLYQGGHVVRILNKESV